MARINPQTASEKIRAATGEFYVEFIKRTDGTTRKMRCQKNDLMSNANPNKAAQDHQNNLVTVFDLDIFDRGVANYKAAVGGRELSEEELNGIAKDCFRSVNLESIITVWVGNKKYDVNDFPVKNWNYTWKFDGTEMTRTVAARVRGEADMAFKRETKLPKLPRGVVVNEQPIQ